MIDGEDECAQNYKWGPLRVHRSHSNPKNKTNQWSHEEHWTRNDVGIGHSRDLAVHRLRLLFFLLFFLSSLNSLTFWTLEPFLSLPSMPIYREMDTWGKDSLPRQAET